MDLTGTALWRDALGIPEVLTDLLAGPPGLSDAAAVLGGAQRIVLTGNGAAYYAALAAALSAADAAGPPWTAVPAGLLASGHHAARPGDVMVVVSSSGELRDVVSAARAGLPHPLVLLTATPGSSLGRAADVVVRVPVRSQSAVTHTQAYCGNVLAGLTLVAAVDARWPSPRLAGLPTLASQALEAAPAWAGEVAAELGPRPVAGVALGSGAGWAAACETALLLKEVAGVPVEGLETREGATSGMYALGPGHLAVAVTGDDLATEAIEVCRRTGATCVALPGAVRADDHVLAPVASFPWALALSAELGLRAGLDVDQPAWTAAYYATARLS